MVTQLLQGQPGTKYHFKHIWFACPTVGFMELPSHWNQSIANAASGHCWETLRDAAFSRCNSCWTLKIISEHVTSAHEGEKQITVTYKHLKVSNRYSNGFIWLINFWRTLLQSFSGKGVKRAACMAVSDWVSLLGFLYLSVHLSLWDSPKCHIPM